MWERISCGGFYASLLDSFHASYGVNGRLVNVYMNQYFCPAAIEEPNFPLSELKEYYVPPDGDLQSCKVSLTPAANTYLATKLNRCAKTLPRITFSTVHLPSG